MKLIDLNGVKVLFDVLMERIGVEIYTKAEADTRFAKKGEAGVKGDRGERGPQGPPGPKGDRGPAGSSADVFDYYDRLKFPNGAKIGVE